MEFTTLAFLFLLLPLLVVAYMLAQVRFRPVLLLAASLLFLAWGRSPVLWAYAFLIGGNYYLGIWIEKLAGHQMAIKPWHWLQFSNSFIFQSFYNISAPLVNTDL